MISLAVSPSTLALIEDAQWLVDTGECWSQAIHRLGYAGRPDSLERRLWRAGRGDLIMALRSREILDLDRPYLHNTRPRTAAELHTLRVAS